MAKRKFRFTVLDFVIILSFLAVIAYSVVANIDIRSFNSENIQRSTVVTLAVNGLERDHFVYFSEGDSLRLSDSRSSFPLGKVSDIRSTPAIAVKEGHNGFNMTPDFNRIDILIDVSTSGIIDRNGFSIIGDRYISPSAHFSGDNGRIIFDCEVVSVKIVD